MDYKSENIKSYLTYYIVDNSYDYYDEVSTHPDDKIISLGEDIVRGFRFCILMKYRCGHYIPFSFISINNRNVLENLSKGTYEDADGKFNMNLHYEPMHYGPIVSLYNLFGVSEGSWVGWNYGHIDDYVNVDVSIAGIVPSSGHKWTSEELTKDILNFYERLILRGII